MQSSLRGLKKRLDGFVSTVTGIGTTRDKKKSIRHIRSVRQHKEWLDDFYADNALARKAVRLLPEDALRKWFNIDHENNAEIQRRLMELCAKKHIMLSDIKARLHGGSGIYIDILDGRDLQDPVNPNYGQFKVLGLRVIEKEDLEPLNASGHANYSANANTAQLFRMWSDGEYINIHRDRMLIFPGEEVSDDYRQENGGWGESVLRGDVEEAITAYGVTHGTVPTIVQDFIIGILKLHGLNELIDADDDATLKSRLDAAMLGESYINKVVIDGEDDYSREVANVSGLDTLIKHPERWAAAVTNIPHTKLLCESAGGSLGEGGKNQKSDWEETVESHQQDVLLEPCSKLVKYIGYEFRINEPLDITFNPLRVLSEAEQAALRKSTAETDAIYIRDGVLIEEEVRASRFNGKWSMETTIDDEQYADYKNMAEEMAEGLANGNQNEAEDQPEANQAIDQTGENDQPSDA